MSQTVETVETVEPVESGWHTVRRGLALTPVAYRGLWLTLLLALVAAAGRIIVPLSIQYVLDHGLAAEPGERADVRRLVLRVVLAGLLAVLVAGLASLLLNRRLVRISEEVLFQLRVRSFAHIVTIAPARLASQRRAALVSRVTSDVDTISEFTRTGGVMLLSNVFQMFAAAVLMAVYSWPLSLLVLVVCLPLVALMRRIQRVVALRFGAVRLRVAGLYGGVGELVRGASVIRAYGASDYMQARVDTQIEEVRAAQLHTQWPLHTNTSLGELTSGLITATVLVLGVVLGIAALPGLPALSVGQLVAFLFLITFFVRPLQFSVSILGEAQSAVAGWRRVLEILDLPTGAVPDDAGVRLVPRTRAGHLQECGRVRGLDVQFEQVGFEYVAGRPALRDLSVTITSGQHVAIVGATGSGKSTFAKLLTRQLLPTSGTIRIGGRELAAVTDSSLARRVAIVPQDAFLFDRSIEMNIALARPGAGRAEVLEVLDRLGLSDWVENLPEGLETQVGQRGETLSAGERQLVALARTALVDPDLLILDEATSGVDPATDVRVQQALTRLSKGLTTVTIAHRMFTAENAGTVLLLHEGRLVEQGTHAQLLAAEGRYADLHGAWAAVRGGAR